MAIEIVFWSSLFLTVYTYLLYPILLFVAASAVQVWRDWQYLRLRGDRRRVSQEPLQLPAVSLVIAAYNEEVHLADKLANLRGLEYPKDRLDIVFVSDGSTDATNTILRAAEAENIRVLYLPARVGKAAALNHALAVARYPIVIFSDAATLFAHDAATNLVRHFSDPRVGVVCGALQFEASSESRQTEGVYWRYESMIRLMESRLGVTLTASGAIYAVRRECLIPLSADTLVEDLVIPMVARGLGFRVLYDPEARATDFAPATVSGEFTRRVRLATGSFRALRQLRDVRIDVMTGLAFVSHKVLRWVLPVLLLAMLIANALLLDRGLYGVLFLGQGIFYTWALLGYVYRDPLRRIRFGLLPYYLLAMHLAFVVGFARFLAGRVEWRRVS